MGCVEGKHILVRNCSSMDAVGYFVGRPEGDEEVNDNDASVGNSVGEIVGSKIRNNVARVKVSDIGNVVGDTAKVLEDVTGECDGVEKG